MPDTPNGENPVSPPTGQGPIAGAAHGSSAHGSAVTRAKWTIAIGLLVTVVGVVLTAATYAMAASNPNGGHYVIAFGPVIFGLLTLARGIRALRMTSRPEMGRQS